LDYTATVTTSCVKTSNYRTIKFNAKRQPIGCLFAFDLYSVLVLCRSSFPTTLLDSFFGHTEESQYSRNQLSDDQQSTETNKQKNQDATVIGLGGIDGEGWCSEEGQGQCSDDCFHDVLLFKFSFCLIYIFRNDRIPEVLVIYFSDW